MKFELDKSLEILERTPFTIETMLDGISDEWTKRNEGPGTWSPYDIVGHLIHGEETDWIPRMEIILADKEAKTFEPFDRFAQFNESKGKTLRELLDKFKELRKQNIERLQAKMLNSKNLEQKGIHPSFGEVTLKQLLSAWVVHDLNHIAQIARVMAKQYKTEVGPWKAYLKIVNL
jgi:uncharacterized damage-inducible protein DinB